jgi:hypothetical protein
MCGRPVEEMERMEADVRAYTGRAPSEDPPGVEKI